MKLTEERVRYVAKLANLSLSEGEVAEMVHHLGGILDHMDRLAEIDTAGVEPMTQVLYEGADASDTLRPDVERESLTNELALANASTSGNGYFKVPKVMER